ncbi:hybrid sensor histidine kinase/response regulator transcription factor [Maribellus sediminis]|uniref:hybrid sensor histidine kinase/response regulator transcription factor n=1 Tax=Maribellus sediminis TaxID=2696285 RepID=UPI0014318767|nr:hybrid sensor histidine kinase/response regulator transcription factor [Maribellus sediminis]
MSNSTGRANDFNITYLSGEDGLSQNEVTRIIQDKNGFMWFGTRGGLNRYDGYEFIHYKSKASVKNHLSNPSIETLIEDSKGNLWIGTKSGGLNFYDIHTKTFSRITEFGKNKQALNCDRIVSIAETKDGNILVGTWSDGLYILDFINDTLQHLLTESQVNHILVDGEKFAWLSTNGAFLRMNLKDYSQVEVNPGGRLNYTESISDSSNDLLWVTAWEGGLMSVDKRSFKIKSHKINPVISSQDNTYTLLLDSQGRMWVGSWNGGLFLFDQKNETFSRVEIKPKQMGSQNTDFDIILDIYEDRDHNIWIATDAGGIVRIGSSKPFGVVSVNSNPDCGLKNFHTSAFYKSPEGVLYVGTRGGGLYKTTDNKKFDLIPFTRSGSSTSIIRFVKPVSEHILWIGTGQDSYELDLTEKKSMLRPIQDKNIFGIKKLTSFLKVDNSLLVGSQQNGLFYISNYFIGSRELINFTPQNNPVLKNERINFIKEDLSGRIWLGTYKGIYFFDKNSREILDINFIDDNKLTSDIIYCWHQTSDSVFWIGTPNGLNKLTQTKSGKFSVTHICVEDGLPDDFIHGILSPDNKEIWVSTNSGLAKLNIENNQIFSFDKTDGLQGMMFSEDQGYMATDGTMYFGGNMGYNYFKQNEIVINKTIPPIVFTRLKVYDKEVFPMQKVNGKEIFKKPLNSNPEIYLTFKEKEFTIEYAALNYNAPERNQYAHKLEGYDSDWLYVGSKRSVTYIGLKPGTYIFKVIGSNNNNVWNSKGNSLKIVIETEPWKSWYALAIYAFLVIGMASLIRWNSIRQLNLANNLKLEKILHKQDQKLNEMKLRFFTNISHEFRTPLTLILAPLKELLTKEEYSPLPSEIQNKIEIARNNSLRLLKLVNQLLDFRKVESGNMKLVTSFTNINKFVAEVCHPFFELAKINRINFELTIDPENEDIWIDRNKVEIVINNLVSNAFKHIPENGSIKVQLSHTKKTVLLSVSDNGPGIPEHEIDKIFDRFYRVEKEEGDGSSGIGLALAKRFVELHKGTISVHSEPNIKTEFSISFQKGSDHLKPAEMHELIIEKSNFAIQDQFIVNRLSVRQNSKKGTGDCVLVVEDNPDLNNYLVEILKPYYNLESGFDGKEGFEIARVKKPQLIISDIMMPNVDGFEFCKKIRDNKDTSNIPFIFLTAKSDEQFNLLGTKSGADDFISKPFDPNLLLEKVKNMLESRKKLKEQYTKIVRLEPSALEISSSDEVFLDKTIAIIEANLQNPNFTSHTISQKMNMSRTSFYRKLKELSDMSIGEFIRSIRLKRAAQLLADKELTITEIAYSVGFSDAKYFRSIFQKQFGCTPSDYRNKLNE